MKHGNPTGNYPTERDPRWAAIVRRDASQDGLFYFSVRTTGVYCRPSCSARRANPKNVTIHNTAADAERAGFRPCRRCTPTLPPLAERHALWIAELCREIEQSGEAPRLTDLAERFGLSVYHLHRLFKKSTGVTPRDFAQSVRARRMKSALSNSRSVTSAIHESGYSSSSRFYEKTADTLGMKPAVWRAGGKSVKIEFTILTCTLGLLLVAATERGVCAISLGDRAETLRAELAREFPRAELCESSGDFLQTVRRVTQLVDEGKTHPALPLDVQGTAFQQKVWRALTRIRKGATSTYSELARAIGAPQSVRAVARACATNKIAIAIPCHRIVRKDGDLAGYRWGLERKKALLAREKQQKE